MSRFTVASHTGRRAGLVKLERAAHFAGESFGYEDAFPLPAQKTEWISARLLWSLVALAAAAGFVFLHFA